MLREHSSGERNKLITIQQLSDGVGASRFPTETWTTLCTAMASQMPLGGREHFVASQISAPFDTQWQISYRPDMDPDLLNVSKVRRVVFEGRVHDIVDAKPVGQKRAVELLTLSGGLVE